MLNLMLIGKRISSKRKELKLTQSFVAESLYVTHQAVSKWENGKSLPTIDILYELTKLLKVSIDFLLDDTDILEHDYETKFKNFDREQVLGDFLKQENYFEYINDIFYLLNSKERFKVINKIVQGEDCFIIKNIWPYLNDEERIYLLGIILGGKCSFEVSHIYHQLTDQEKLFVSRKVTHNTISSKE